MKKLILLSLLGLLSVNAVCQKREYALLDSAKFDIVEYLQKDYAFADKFIGQKVSVLLEEIKVPFSWMLDKILIAGAGIQPLHEVENLGLLIRFYDADYEYRLEKYNQEPKRFFRPQQYYFISITFDSLPNEYYDKFNHYNEYSPKTFPVEIGNKIISGMN